jgi:glucokinase
VPVVVDNDVNAAALGAAQVLHLGGSAIAAAWPSSNGLAPAVALFAAASAGDSAACRVRDVFAGHLASAVRLLVLTCDVETVVLGGGVTEVGRPLVDAVVAGLRRQAESSPFLAALELPSRVAVVPAGSPVAAIGAALCGVAACASFGDVGRLRSGARADDVVLEMHSP